VTRPWAGRIAGAGYLILFAAVGASMFAPPGLLLALGLRLKAGSRRMKDHADWQIFSFLAALALHAAYWVLHAPAVREWAHSDLQGALLLYGYLRLAVSAWLVYRVLRGAALLLDSGSPYTGWRRG
jgi:uncharacterized membrane protein